MYKKVFVVWYIFVFSFICTSTSSTDEDTLSLDDTIKQTVPNTARTFLDRGILFASRGDYTMAISDFTEAIRIDSALESAYMLRGRAYFAGASYVTGIGENFSIVTTTITNGRNTPEEERRNYDLAITDFTQAILLNQNNAHAYRERGVAYSDKGDYDQAIQDLTQAIKLMPNYAVTYNNRGNTYRAKGEYDRAIIDYNQAIRIDPNYARAYMNRGGTYADKKEYDRAISDHTKAIKLAPNDAITYNNRGGDYYDIGDYDRAIIDYNQAIKLDPNSAVNYANRGAAYINKGDYDRAISDFKQALRLDPNDSYAKDGLEFARKRGK